MPRISLDFDRMSDRELILHLVERLNDLPERMCGVEEWQQRATGALIILTSSVVVSLFIMFGSIWLGG